MKWRGGVHINNKTTTVTLHAPHALRVNELDLGIHTCICTHTHTYNSVLKIFDYAYLVVDHKTRL